MNVTVVHRINYCDHGKRIAEDCIECTREESIRFWRGVVFASLISLPFWFVILLWLFGGMK